MKHETVALAHNLTVDFNKLALLEPALRSHVLILNDRVVWNFAEQQSLIVLAQAILRHCFGLKWECPPGNLCPRVPSRLNYLLWLSARLPNIRRVLDVGTGATLIYPLLGWALFKWRFLATDLNPSSLESSRRILRANQLQQVIQLRQACQSEMESILHPTIAEDEELCLVICNPPFFQEEAERRGVMEAQEHHVEGGEYAFFFALYKDSFRYPRIRHFSCLLGRATDFHVAKAFLEDEHREGYLSSVWFGEIVQGRNKRFILLWRTAGALP